MDANTEFIMLFLTSYIKSKNRWRDVKQKFLDHLGNSKPRGSTDIKEDIEVVEKYYDIAHAVQKTFNRETDGKSAVLFTLNVVLKKIDPNFDKITDDKHLDTHLRTFLSNSSESVICLENTLFDMSIGILAGFYCGMVGDVGVNQDKLDSNKFYCETIAGKFLDKFNASGTSWKFAKPEFKEYFQNVCKEDSELRKHYDVYVANRQLFDCTNDTCFDLAVDIQKSYKQENTDCLVLTLDAIAKKLIGGDIQISDITDFENELQQYLKKGTKETLDKNVYDAVNINLETTTFYMTIMFIIGFYCGTIEYCVDDS